MITIYVEHIDSSRAWGNWSGHARAGLADRLKIACPSLRPTARKRLARQLLSGTPVAVIVEVESAFGSVWHLLESIGAVMSVDRSDVFEKGLPASPRGSVIKAQEIGGGRFRPAPKPKPNQSLQKTPIPPA